MDDGVGRKKRKVLVIDSDPVLLQQAKAYMRGRFTVAVASSGEQALAMFERGYVPDLVLFDIDSAETLEKDALRRLRIYKRMSGVPLICMAKRDELESKISRLPIEAVDFVMKPLIKSLLLARVQLHMDGSLRPLPLRDDSQSPAIDEMKFETAAAQLTNTERKVARMIALGYTNQEIGENLGYSYCYIKKLASIVYEKLNASRRHDLRRLLK